MSKPVRTHYSRTISIPGHRGPHLAACGSPLNAAYPMVSSTLANITCRRCIAIAMHTPTQPEARADEHDERELAHLHHRTGPSLSVEHPEAVASAETLEQRMRREHPAHSIRAQVGEQIRKGEVAAREAMVQAHGGYRLDAVLWYFNDVAYGMEPGSFVSHLLDTMAAADLGNRAKLVAAFPEVGVPFEIAKTVENGTRALAEAYYRSASVTKAELLALAAEITEQARA